MTSISDQVESGTTSLVRSVEQRLACPRCHASLAVASTLIRCSNPACGFEGALADGVVLLGDRSKISFFDDRHQVMQHGNTSEAIRCMCYEHQARFLEPYLRPGSVVLDVGCGPTLPYRRPKDCFLIGLEASYDSIRVNSGVDLPVYGTASDLPLPNETVDTIVCLYSMHHMVGETIRENWTIAARALSEFGRVVKPGGDLFIFEVSPWPPFWLAEQMVWNAARRVLGPKLEMHFWSARTLASLGRAVLPNATFQQQTFGASLLNTFPPAFSLPWLRIPRFLYPFDVNLYWWHWP